MQFGNQCISIFLSYLLSGMSLIYSPFSHILPTFKVILQYIPLIFFVSIMSLLVSSPFSSYFLHHLLAPFCIWCTFSFFLLVLIFNPEVKNLLSNTRDTGLIPGQGTKVPRVTGQLSLSTTTREHYGLWSVCVVTKTWCSQINR